jgi:hypothetical protein
MTSPILYCKEQVISAIRIKKSEWYEYRENGIIPPTIGREGNAHRWSSTIINAIGNRMLILGKDYRSEHTINILLEDLEKTEALINSYK